VAGAMSKLSAEFAEQNISIEGITQKEPAKGQDTVSVIFITQKAREGLVDNAIKKLEAITVK